MKRRHPVLRAGLFAGLTALLVSMATGCSNDSDGRPGRDEVTAALDHPVSSSVFETARRSRRATAATGRTALHALECEERPR